jgi:putative membrane protein
MSALWSAASSTNSIVAYCGTPPSPATLLRRWNFDPILAAALIGLLVTYLVFSAKHGLARRGAFAAGWALGALALISPLCPLSVSLFSARVGQHMVLTALVAPLVALGHPGGALANAVRWLTRGRLALAPRRPEPLLAAAAFAAALWTWHAPAPYAATFTQVTLYWLMHLTTFGAALWLWTAVLDGSGERLAGTLAAIFLTTGQMGLLGALITFADRPLYAPHLSTPFVWGLTPLADQQLGGVLMWLPAGAIFAAGLVFAFLAAMKRAETRSLSLEGLG